MKRQDYPAFYRPIVAAMAEPTPTGKNDNVKVYRHDHQKVDTSIRLLKFGKEAKWTDKKLPFQGNF